VRFRRANLCQQFHHGNSRRGGPQASIAQATSGMIGLLCAAGHDQLQGWRRPDLMLADLSETFPLLRNVTLPTSGSRVKWFEAGTSPRERLTSDKPYFETLGLC
jgi:hypothetical protein